MGCNGVFGEDARCCTASDNVLDAMLNTSVASTSFACGESPPVVSWRSALLTVLAWTDRDDRGRDTVPDGVVGLEVLLCRETGRPSSAAIFEDPDRNRICSEETVDGEQVVVDLTASLMDSGTVSGRIAVRVISAALTVYLGSRKPSSKC